MHIAQFYMRYYFFGIFFGPIISLVFLQHTSLSPDGKLVVIVGDDPEGLLVDSQRGEVQPTISLSTQIT